MTIKDIESEQDQSRGQQDQENSTEDDETTEAEEKEQKQKPQQQTPALTETTVRQLNQTIQNLHNLVSSQNGSKTEQNKISKVESELSALIKDGYKEEGVTAIAKVVMALQEDLEDKYAQKIAADGQAAFNQRCRENLIGMLDQFCETHPQAVWARTTIFEGVKNAIDNDPQFANELRSYQSGNMPDFKKPFRMITEKYLKENGMKSGDKSSSGNIDTKDSRRLSDGAISKDGKVNLEKLSEVERQVYTDTLNVTKNKELALKALKNVAPHLGR